MAMVGGGGIGGLLVDLDGVLFSSGEGGGAAIEGSVDAVKRLQASSFPVCFCSNESSNTRADLVVKLRGFGFDISMDQIQTPGPMAAARVRKQGLRPFLLVNKRLLPEFEGISTEDPNCVILGDAMHDFTFENVNTAFNILLRHPKLFSMGMGKYYMTTKGLNVDLGAYAKALEFAADCKAEIIGKPSPSYFQAALDHISLSKDEVLMVGDDLISDIGGAQDFGMRAVCVQTGKWRPEWANHERVKPDAIVKNLAEFVDKLLATQS